MDSFFERFHRMMDEMVFSGFFDREFSEWNGFRTPFGLEPPRISPRDEMLRTPEDEVVGDLPTPEPWTPFPFYGDLVKPDMMDRDFFKESQRRRAHEHKKDIILDDQPATGEYAPQRRTQVRTWGKSISRKRFTGPDGQTVESETEMVCEPDGTQVYTTVERSHLGEKTRTVRRKPSGEEEVSETQLENPHKFIPPITAGEQTGRSVEPSTGLFSKVKRWIWG